MEGVKPDAAYLESLGYRVRKLASASLSLSNLLAEEAVRLNWRDEASRLEVLYLSIRQQLDQAKSNEEAASYGYSKANLTVSLGKLAVGSIIKAVSKNEQLQTISNYLLNSLGDERSPFGTVLVCIGTGGMPDDVQVVSISKLARDSDREECDVTDEIQRRGHLLLTEKGFSALIDKLTCDVREGRQFLPVSIEKLNENKGSSHLKLELKKQS